jgi:hypothetical protein
MLGMVVNEKLKNIVISYLTNKEQDIFIRNDAMFKKTYHTSPEGGQWIEIL